MTKAELVQALADVNIESMDYQQLIELATQKMSEILSKQSKSELQDQFEYAFGTDK
jgi:nucleoid DNA-binding protein